MTDFNDVLTYVSTRATRDEVKQLFDAGNARSRVLQTIAAAETASALEPGVSVVRVKDIRPAYLKGLTGKLLTVETMGRKQVARLELDRMSSLMYSRNKRGGFVMDSTSPELSILDGIPLSCLEIVR